MTLTLIRDIPPPATHYSPHHIVHTAAGPAQALFLVVRLYAASYLNVIINFFLSTGIFDCIKKTWSIYSDNPKNSRPIVVLPLELKSHQNGTI